MTDEALTTEQLRERIGYTIAGFMLTDGHLIYRADTQIKLRDAILALIASAQGKDGGEGVEEKPTTRKELAIYYAKQTHGDGVDWDLLGTDYKSRAYQRADADIRSAPSPSKTERTPGPWGLGTCPKCEIGPSRDDGRCLYAPEHPASASCPMKKDG